MHSTDSYLRIAFSFYKLLCVLDRNFNLWIWMNPSMSEFEYEWRMNLTADQSQYEWIWIWIWINMNDSTRKRTNLHKNESVCIIVECAQTNRKHLITAQLIHLGGTLIIFVDSGTSCLKWVRTYRLKFFTSEPCSRHRTSAVPSFKRCVSEKISSK